MGLIRNAGKRSELLLYGEIGGWFGGVEADAVAAELSAVPLDRGLDVRINSPGGDVFDGLAIANLLLARPDVVVYVDGVAASIASVIAVAASEVVMGAGTRLMIHDPWAITAGTADDHDRRAALLRSVRADLLGVYAHKAGANRRAELDAAMAAETWYGADEAVAAGLADRVAERSRVAACLIAAGRYQRTPADLLASESAAADWRRGHADRARRLARARQ